MNPTITRKEIAALAGCSEDTVATKETKWGLHNVRSKALTTPICYFRESALKILRDNKIIPPLAVDTRHHTRQAPISG